MSIESIAEAGFAPVAASIAAGRIPGAVLGVLRADGAMAVRVGGAAQLEPERVAATRATSWDLASLTKPIFTATAILRLVEQGRIALDDALARAIPDLRQYDMNAAERRLTFRQCLAHATFLPAVEPLYTLGQDPDTLRAYVLQRNGARDPASTPTSTSSCSGSRWSASPGAGWASTTPGRASPSARTRRPAPRPSAAPGAGA